MSINCMKYALLSLAVLFSSALYGQEKDSVAVATADTLRRDSVAQQTKPEPVRPVRTLGKVAVIDTLPTANDALSIILFNDNT